MSEKVYVNWYNKVVEGEIINQHDMFGMVAVCIPIQGMRATALFHPSHVHNTQQEACGEYHKPAKFVFPHLPESVGETMEKAIADVKFRCSEDYLAIQQFKEAHWDHEHNRLHLDYWKEFEQMWHDYVAKRLGMMRQQPQQQTEIKQEYPLTNEEAMNMKPLAPKTIGKPYTVTELSLF